MKVGVHPADDGQGLGRFKARDAQHVDAAAIVEVQAVVADHVGPFRRDGPAIASRSSTLDMAS